MNAPHSGGQPLVDLEALRAHILTLGSPPTLISIDEGLPESLRDALTAFPHGSLQGAAGSGPPEIDSEGTRLTLPLVIASQEWPAGTTMALVATGVTVTVTAEGATTLLLDAVHDKTDVTATVTADGPGRLAAAVRPVQPGAYAGALETLGRAFAGDAVWEATAAGLQEFALSPDQVAGFDYRLDRKDGAYTATSMAVVAALDLKGTGGATALGLDISLWFPDLRVTGRLRGGAPVDVRELLTSFGMPVAEVPEGLGSAGLSFAADLGDAYLVRAKLTGSWDIAPALTLRGISLDLSYSREEKFVARFGGTVAIGRNISIDVSAAQVGGGQGWSFYGGLTAGTTVGIGDVVTELGLTDVPGPLESMTLTSLWVSHTTGTGRTEFVCQGDLAIAEGLTASLGVAVTRDSSGTRYGGTLDVDGFRFDLLFDTAAGGKDVFVATYRASGDDPLRISLRDWIAALFPEAADGVPADLSIALDGAKFARVKPPGGAARFCVGVDLSAALDLSALPLVGEHLPAAGDLGIENLQIVYSSGDFDATTTAAVNRLLSTAGVGPLPAVGLKPGPAARADLRLGPAVLELSAGVSAPTSPGKPPTRELPTAGTDGGLPAVVSAAPPPADRGGLWVDVGRAFGPVQIQRIGLSYDHGKLWFMFDGSLGAAGLDIAVQGLGLGFDLGGDPLLPEPRLDGLLVSFERPPLRVGGGLITRRQPGYDLMVQGQLAIEMPTFGVTAVGAYQRKTGGATSMFVFGRATAAFGGPPPFRVTGVALGFGYNSSVRVPAQDEVSTFPFVAGLDGDLPEDPMQALARLTDGSPPWVSAREGQIWLAGGLDFTSFEFLRARVLLLLEAGNDLTIALLGHAVASFPKTGRAYARIGVDLRVVFQSARGELAASAQLVDSYVIDPSCVLTGGFAFSSWFSPSPYAGDFVLTVGGYHPDYKPQKHFPVVPRLGFTWSVGSAVSITGAAYFALTPNAVMAGGLLDVRYNAGIVEAWLTAKADILIQWAPLHFRAGISVRVGAKVKLLFTISGELGASLDLWGPPTGGTVTAKFVFITVTVRFGASLAGPPPLTWSEFRTQLLPPEKPLTAHPLTGLLTDSDADPELRAARVEAGEEPWLADPSGFSFAVSTVVPTARARFNEREPVGQGTVDIRPMGEKDIDGLLHVTVAFSDTRRGQRAEWRAVPGEELWRVEAQRGNVPFSLWGDPDVPQKDSLGQTPLLDHVTGLRVTVPGPKTVGQDLGPIAESDLAQEWLGPDVMLPLDPAAVPGGSPVHLAEPAGAGVGVLADELATLSAGTARTRMHSALAGLLPGIPLPNGTVSAYADGARALGLDADPLLLTEDPAPPHPDPVLLVLDDTTGQILTVDPLTTAVIGRVPVGRPGPYLAVTSADGASLYATGPDGQEIAVIDTVAQRARPPRGGITLGGRPTVLAVRRDATRAVVACPAPFAAASVDLTGDTPPVHTRVDHQDVRNFGGIAVDVEAGRLYVNANDASSTVTYDTASGELRGKVWGPATPTFVTPGEPGRVYVYGAAAGSNGQVQVMPVPTSGATYTPYNFTASGTALAMLTTSARRAVVLRAVGDTGHVVTLYERQGSPPVTVMESEVALGAAPLGLALDPRDRAWVRHAAAVSVVAGGALLAELPLGAAPLSLTFTPDAGRAFIACDDATVAVVDLGADGPALTGRWQLPPGTLASAALFTTFSATASEGAAR
ncbi:DUF6603 domain-containing protein [Streptomyces albireticuli]|uniref:DUF6603 domain-containing protein n=1 Tax=Streptomyces albireticuli TaxID=1940 RepID=A0A2A2DDW5_9ACTN|nr:DUF6603 domain-containing protein [Streptomyces albireticuli]MCD9145393.1 hypothetical protein [Streptomyces albireticuli]MCD9165042.1 hypothetical protein [Streptomyces albireticuli]MCD9195367.1 hypothetical protein [Streptomyces albireticuli]PAU49636.1 hypothetical protein CK936_06720 [Streptomyces albireticuli]